MLIDLQGPDDYVDIGCKQCPEQGCHGSPKCVLVYIAVDATRVYFAEQEWWSRDEDAAGESEEDVEGVDEAALLFLEDSCENGNKDLVL